MHQRKSACQACNISKVRCVMQENGICERCARRGIECLARVRRRGSLNILQQEEEIGDALCKLFFGNEELTELKTACLTIVKNTLSKSILTWLGKYFLRRSQSMKDLYISTSLGLAGKLGDSLLDHFDYSDDLAKNVCARHFALYPPHTPTPILLIFLKQGFIETYPNYAFSYLFQIDSNLNAIIPWLSYLSNPEQKKKQRNRFATSLIQSTEQEKVDPLVSLNSCSHSYHSMQPVSFLTMNNNILNAQFHQTIVTYFSGELSVIVLKVFPVNCHFPMSPSLVI